MLKYELGSFMFDWMDTIAADEDYEGSKLRGHDMLPIDYFMTKYSYVLLFHKLGVIE